MLKIIQDKEKNIIAYVWKADWSFDGLQFLTPDEEEFQLGVMKHEKGHHIRAHCHKNIKNKQVGTNEMIYIVEGKISVTLYAVNQKELETFVLNSGDLILAVGGGHSFDMLEDTKMFEVKQGPYKGVENDKVFLE